MNETINVINGTLTPELIRKLTDTLIGKQLPMWFTTRQSLWLIQECIRIYLYTYNGYDINLIPKYYIVKDILKLFTFFSKVTYDESRNLKFVISKNSNIGSIRYCSPNITII